MLYIGPCNTLITPRLYGGSVAACGERAVLVRPKVSQAPCGRPANLETEQSRGNAGSHINLNIIYRA